MALIKVSARDCWTKTARPNDRGPRTLWRIEAAPMLRMGVLQTLARSIAWPLRPPVGKATSLSGGWPSCWI